MINKPTTERLRRFSYDTLSEIYKTADGIIRGMQIRHVPSGHIVKVAHPHAYPQRTTAMKNLFMLVMESKTKERK